MVTLEDRVLNLYAETNPVPSVEDLGLIAEEATEYLATLDTRSSEVAQLDTKPDPETPERQSQTTWLIAAILALVVGVAVLLISQNGSEAELAGTTLASVPEATPTTLADPLAEFDPYGGSGSGTFTAARSTVPFALTVPDGWVGHSDRTPDRLALCVPNPNSEWITCDVGGGFARAAILGLELGTVDETRQYLSSLDGAVLGDIEEVDVGGADGIRFTYENDVPYWPSETTDPPFPIVATVTPGGKIPIGNGELGRAVVTIVDVAGTTMTLVYQGYSADRGHHSDGFADHFEEGMAIVDSIMWGDLP